MVSQVQAENNTYGCFSPVDVATELEQGRNSIYKHIRCQLNCAFYRLYIMYNKKILKLRGTN